MESKRVIINDYGDEDVKEESERSNRFKQDDKEIKQDTFQIFNSLERLDLSWNQISEIDENVLPPCKNLGKQTSNFLSKNKL